MRSTCSLRRFARNAAVIAAILGVAAPAAAQAPQTPAPPAPAPPVADSKQPPTPPGRLEPELNLINGPTTRSLNRHQHYFRLTHRFARDLRRGDFGQLLEDLFGLDSGAIIGLEYRFAPTAKLQAGVHRSMLFKTIQMFGRYDLWRQGDSIPVSVSPLASIEGDDNFSERYQPAVGTVVSRTFGDRIAVYASPIVVWNTLTLATGHEEHEHEHEGIVTTPVISNEDYTFFTGLGGRFRFLRTAYLVVEYTPRVAGYDPGEHIWGVGIEKYTRGHGFQLNLTNSFGTTYAQVARGGDEHNIYLGFNITRRF
jgi:hypothetical protein